MSKCVHRCVTFCFLPLQEQRSNRSHGWLWAPMMLHYSPGQTRGWTCGISNPPLLLLLLCLPCLRQRLWSSSWPCRWRKRLLLLFLLLLLRSMFLRMGREAECRPLWKSPPRSWRAIPGPQGRHTVNKKHMEMTVSFLFFFVFFPTLQ